MKQLLFVINLLLATLLVAQSFSQSISWQWGGLNPNQITVASGNRVFVSFATNGLAVTTDLGNSWTNLGLTNKDLRQVCVSPTNGYIFVAVAGGGGIYRSTDNGNTWTETDNGMGRVATRAITVNSSGQLFAGTWLYGVYKSNDNGANWVAVSSAFDVYDILVNSGNVFIGCAQGIYASTDNGSTWTLENSGVIQATVTSFAVNPSGHVFASTYDVGHIYRSTNNGISWVRINTGINARHIQDIVFNPSNGNGFAATDSGVYRTTNNFATWTSITAGVPIVYSYPQLLGMTPSGYLFASFACGALLRSTNSTEVNDVPTFQPISFVLKQNYPNPFNPSTTIEYELPARCNIQINVYNSIGQLVKTLVDGKVEEAGSHAITWGGRNDAGSTVSSGTYFYQIRIDGQMQAKKMLVLR